MNSGRTGNKDETNTKLREWDETIMARDREGIGARETVS